MNGKLGLLFLLFTSSFCHSGETAVPFLLFSPTARTTSLGGAFVAVADDASATYYNPAGLAFQSFFNSTLTYSNWLPGFYPGMDYGFLSLTNSLPKGTIGGNVIYLNTGKTEVINSQGTYLGEYTQFDLAFTLSYGYPLFPNFGIGLSFKYIYSLLFPEWLWEAMPELGITSGGTGITWGADFGILYKPFKWFNFGSALLNIGSDFKYFPEGEPQTLPKMWHLGANFVIINNELTRLFIPLEADIGLTDFYLDSWSWHYELRKITRKSLGMEFSYANFITFRMSYLTDWQPVPYEDLWRLDIPFLPEWTLVKRKGLSYGFGLQWKGFAVDLGFDYLLYSFPTSDWKVSFAFKM